MRYILKIKILIIILLFYSLLLIAEEDLNKGPIREFYRSPHAMGMGNAYATSVKDCEALYYNPAALGKLKKDYIGEYVNPQLSANRQFYNLAMNYSTISSDNDSFIKYLEEKVGKPQYANFAYTPSVCYRNMGMGIFDIAEYDTMSTNPADPRLRMYVRNDYGITFGGAQKLFGGRIKLGMSLKYIHRSEVDTTVTAKNVAGNDFSLEESKAGTGIAIDSGLLMTLPIQTLPRASVVVENVGDTSFTESSTSMLGSSITGAPSKMRQKVHFGVGITPYINQLTKLNLNLEMRDAFRPTDDYYRLMHVGFELLMPKTMTLRMGFNQGYLTYGFTFDLKHAKLDFASYGQELGAYAGQQQDTRYMMKCVLGF